MTTGAPSPYIRLTYFGEIGVGSWTTAIAYLRTNSFAIRRWRICESWWRAKPNV